MYVSTTTFELPPNLAPFTDPLKTFHNSYDNESNLIVGAFIFTDRQPNVSQSNKSTHTKTDISTVEPRLLLLHRASADSYGDLWDFPGGSVEESDKTLIDAVKREVFEETGLHVSEIVEYIGMHTWADISSGRAEKCTKLSFTVKVEEESQLAGAETDAIKLAETEHQSFMWAMERDVKASMEEKEGALKFIAMEEIEIAAEAFRRFKLLSDLSST